MRRALFLLAAAAIALGVYATVHWYGLRYGRRPLIPAASNLLAAPDLSLTDLNGTALRTSDYKGKVVLVNFWAAWCTPCAEEVPQFMALEKKYQDQGLQVIGFSVEDDAAELRDFYRKYHMNYPVIPGDLRISDAFGGVLGLPTTFLIGRDNLVHAKYNGATDFSVLEREVVALLHAPRS
jgi:peroxiredoxin